MELEVEFQVDNYAKYAAFMNGSSPARITKPEILRVLKESEAWLSDRNHWCKWHLFVPYGGWKTEMNKESEIVHNLMLQTGQFESTCGLGSLLYSSGVKCVSEYNELFKSVVLYLEPFVRSSGASIPDINDSDDGYRRILDTWREAITRLEEEIIQKTSHSTKSLQSSEKDQENILVAV